MSKILFKRPIASLIKWVVFLILLNTLTGCSSQKNGLSPDAAGIYQNTSQTAKGIVVGGVAGGIVGSLGNGIGVIPGTVTGIVLGGTLGAYLDSHSSLVEQLKQRGVKVVILGDQIRIVIPSFHLFHCMSANIQRYAYPTLDLVTQLIGRYVNISVTVASYTNLSGDLSADLKRSQQQAESVARYLWRQGVNTRLLFSEGFGATNLMTTNSSVCPNNANYRVEINLEKVAT